MFVNLQSQYLLYVPLYSPWIVLMLNRALAAELPHMFLFTGSYSMATKSTWSTCFARNANGKHEKQLSISLKSHETMEWRNARNSVLGRLIWKGLEMQTSCFSVLYQLRLPNARCCHSDICFLFSISQFSITPND